MRIGTVIGVPDNYTRFGRIKDDYGVGYTVEPGELPEDMDVGDQFAYKVEIWANDSGLAYNLNDD